MSALKDKYILVIDDEADMRLLARKILEGDGARVADASTIESGLAVAKKSPPHLILLDLGLPDASGFDFLKSRKEISSLDNVPVVILSGKNDKISVTEAIALGAKDYILKPIKANLVLQKVRKALVVTSFFSKKLKDQIKASFSLSAEITTINEGGCQVEAPIKLSAGDLVKVKGELIDKLDLGQVSMKVSARPAEYVNTNRYLNEIYFAGMNEERAKKVRLKGGT